MRNPSRWSSAPARAHGSVTVFPGSQRLRTISLAGPVGYRKVVAVATFATARSGTVRIVVNNRKPVRIDGLGVAT